MSTSKGKDRAWHIARELLIRREMSQPMKRTHAELKRGLPPFTSRRTIPLNRNDKNEVDKRKEQS